MQLSKNYFLAIVTLSLFPLLSLDATTHTTLEFFPISELEHVKHTAARRPWTFIVYMAADNDLNFFAKRNLLEMQNIGSNDNIAIVAQLDGNGPQEPTKRIYITKNKLYEIIPNAPQQPKINSGTSQALIDCCKWAVTSYPADHYALILWNHGTGIIDSVGNRTVNSSELFTFNPTNHLLELDRSIGFLEFLEYKDIERDPRGICFNNTYGSYLTNQRLDDALRTISRDVLGGKKFDFIGFDACLMAMVEVADLIRPYAHYMVASEEVELGTGWPYQIVLRPFLTGSLDTRAFVQHIVTSYGQAYQSITRDFTQSAIWLDELDPLENNIKHVSYLLLEMLYHQIEHSAKQAIKASKSRRTCICFAEPSYIDLHHFYSNMLRVCQYIKVENSHKHLLKELTDALHQGLSLIERTVVAKVAGDNLQKVGGISIYFPTGRIHHSYLQTSFIRKTNWAEFLELILSFN